MSLKDLREVNEIEIQCFSTPWPISSFKYELKHKHSILKVGVLSGKIIGYICVRTILDETQILNLAVLPLFRRRGIGTMLLRDVLKELSMSQLDKKHLTLEVRESNRAAIELYEKFNFKLKGKRIGYYSKPPENAVIMGFEPGENNTISKPR